MSNACPASRNVPFMYRIALLQYTGGQEKPLLNPDSFSGQAASFRGSLFFVSSVKISQSVYRQ